MGDYEIIERIKSGSSSAIDELYTKYATQAVRTAYLICSDMQGAEDIFQESFILCLRNISSLRNPDSFRYWFYKILTRQAWKYLRHNKICIPVEEICEDKNHSADDEYFRDQKYDTLYNAIKSLDDKKRMTVILFYFNGMSVSEIAKVMSCREGTVKSRLFSARSELRKIIEEEGLK